MVYIEVQFDGLKENINRINMLSKRGLGTIRSATYEEAKRVAERARILAPKHTGKLADTISAKKTDTGAIIKAGGPNAPYALYQEVGFRPHVVPRSYIENGARGFVYVSKHTPYIKPAVDQVLGVSPMYLRLQRIHKKAIRRLLSRLKLR